MCLEQPPLAQVGVEMQHAARCQKQQKVFEMQLKIGTYNAQTLRDNGGRQRKGRVATRRAIEEQFHAGGFVCVGLQETRSKTTGESSTCRYHVFAAAADENGQGGCELWLSKSLPYAAANKQPCRCSLRSCTVLSCSHRHIIVKYEDNDWKCIFVVAHSPHSRAEEKVRATFWARLAKAVESYASWPIVTMIDANAKVGAETGEEIGSYRADCPTENGIELEKYLRRTGCFLPATFEEDDPEDDTGTWHKNGVWHRLDFIALPKSWFRADIVSGIAHDVDTLKQHLDHRPVFAKVMLSDVQKQLSVQEIAKKVSCDRRTVKTPAGRQRCKELMREVRHTTKSALAWDAEIDAAASALGTLCAQKAAKEFPLVAKWPAKSWISARAWDLIQEKKKLRRSMRSTNFVRKKGEMREIFKAWKVLQKGGQYRVEVPFHAWIKLCDFTVAASWKQFNNVASDLQCALQNDEAEHLQKLAAEAGRAESAQGLAL